MLGSTYGEEHTAKNGLMQICSPRNSNPVGCPHQGILTPRRQTTFQMEQGKSNYAKFPHIFMLNYDKEYNIVSNTRPDLSGYSIYRQTRRYLPINCTGTLLGDGSLHQRHPLRLQLYWIARTWSVGGVCCLYARLTLCQGAVCALEHLANSPLFVPIRHVTAF
jgi:hypothetical protein